MDLLDWHRGRLSSRRLAVLVRHLPRDSAVLRDLHGEATDWSVTDHLLATAVDHLAESNWMFAAVNRDEDSEPPEYPEPVPRPESTPRSEGTEEPSGPDRPGPAGQPDAAQLLRFFS